MADALPVFDLSSYLANPASPEAVAVCKDLAEFVRRTGIAVIRDPRVSEDDSASFLDTMEKYFEQPHDTKMPDVKPQFSYQVGATPELVETCRCSQEPDCLTHIQDMPTEHRPHIPRGPDPKWRFFWRVGPRTESTKFPELHAEPVIPAAFPEWPRTMDAWGNLMLGAVTTMAQMLATGLELPANTFSDMMHAGPHLLAPTGSDLQRFSEVGTIMAGYHYDLNFLTIHGKSRFPGLFVWLRDNTKIPVKVPAGCLLVQAGKQLEYVTAGHFAAGYHEVVVTQDTANAVAKAKEAGKSIWRVSSTVFSHVNSDVTLHPIGRFAASENASKYPPILAGDQVEKELEFIKLAPAAAAATS